MVARVHVSTEQEAEATHYDLVEGNPGQFVEVIVNAPAEVARPCYHPRSCAQCDRVGAPCEKHWAGTPGHERCSGHAPA